MPHPHAFYSIFSENTSRADQIVTSNNLALKTVIRFTEAIG